MTDLFLSDLHLDQSRPGITRLFLDYLATSAPAAKRLFILGDLFESWVGDDDPNPLSLEIARGLRRLSDSGTKISFIHGNRDFLLGEDYARRCGMELLDDPSLVTIGQQTALLSHGDTLCTDDHAYQTYRCQVRSSRWQREFLGKPLDERLEHARQARAQSARHTAKASPAIMDVNAGAVAALMRSKGVNLLIHGHTHRPAIHDLTIDSVSAQRIVLGDWYRQGSILVAHRGQFELTTITLQP